MVKYCKKCGTKIEENNKFCGNCGTSSVINFQILGYDIDNLALGSGFVTILLILSLYAAVLGYALGILVLILGIISLVQGKKIGRKKTKAIIGLLFVFIALIIQLLFIFVGVPY